MATSLDKPVTRVTNATYRDSGKDREIVVTLSPSGDNAYITMKPKGSRGEDMSVTVNIKTLYERSIVRKHMG